MLEFTAPAFTLADARAAGIGKDRIYDLLQRGDLERIARGVFVRPGALDPSLVTLAAATAVHQAATLCLTSALVHHDLSDAIPFGAEIALPRGTRHPAGFDHASWHSFDPDTFGIGRELRDIGGMSVAIYSAERTIIDSFRLMHREGSDVAHEALRRWLRGRGNSPATLLRTAKPFPTVAPRLRLALEALL